tara:strand:+ start:676 stop:861 length:186 start_codon:yes stop_codon:yes gene_type:complete
MEILLMKQIIANACYVLGFASIGLSAYTYSSAGVDQATYVGLWVPSFFLVGFFFEKLMSND